MIITIYELLGLIKDGKAPKKIRYGLTHYKKIYLDDGGINYQVHNGSMKLFDEEFFEKNRLNNTVEILEEENKIEKLNINLNIDDENKVNYYRANNLECDLAFKINELIDEINKIKDGK